MTVLDPTAIARPTLTGHPNRRIHLRGFLIGKGYYTAAASMDYAETYHNGTRKDGTTPEFAHQVSIVSYLTTILPHLRHPERALVAGFVHDTPEDYDVSFDELDRRFGPDTSLDVRPLTKTYRGTKRDPDEVAAAQAESPVASVVKGADRINNVQTMMGVFSETKIIEYIDETRTHILPMLKQARRNFPDQEGAYQNLRLVLQSQVELLEGALAGLILRQTD